MRHDGCLGLRRTVRPPRLIEGIGVDSGEVGAGPCSRGPKALERFGAVQAWIVADGLAGDENVLKIGRHAALDEVPDLEYVDVHLILDLKRVAAVHEDRGFACQDHRRPGRPREAGGPGQTVMGGGQVFILVLILVRNKEAVETLGGHGRADQGKMARTERTVGGFIEGLAHDAGLDQFRAAGNVGPRRRSLSPPLRRSSDLRRARR